MPTTSSTTDPRTTSVAYERLLDRLTSIGVPDRAAAARAARATVAVLGQRLTDEEARRLGTKLPAELAHLLDQSEYDGDFDAAELYERVRRRARLEPGQAREEVPVVLRALGELLDGELLGRLAHVLPRPLGEQLSPRDETPPPEHAPRSHAPPLTTLASGRPGSRHPLSEAAPPSGQTHSVAANDDPHAEAKLSSSHGLSQERFHESLATGHPPEPERPIDEANDD